MWTTLDIPNTKVLFPLEGFSVACWEPVIRNHQQHHQNQQQQQQQPSPSPVMILYGGVGPLGRGNNNIYIMRDVKEGWKMQPTTNVIVNSSVLSKHRMDHSMCIIGNNLYVFGGRSGMSNKPLSDDGHILYMLNLESFVWTSLLSSSSSSIIPPRSSQFKSTRDWLHKTGSPIARYGHSMTCSNRWPKLFFMFGGLGMVPLNSGTTNGSLKPQLSELNDFWTFNTSTKQWQSFELFKKSQGITTTTTSAATVTATHNSSMVNAWPKARYGHISHIVNNALYIIGGGTVTTTNGMKDIWKLDLTTMIWTQIHVEKSVSVYIPIRDSASIVIGSKILLYGGLISKSENLSCLLVFDTVHNQIGMIESSSIVPQLPNGLLRHSMVQYGLNFILMGGKQKASSLIPAKSGYNTNIYQFSLTIPDPPKPKIVTRLIQNPQTGQTFEEKEAVSQVSEGYLILRDQKLDMLAELLKSNDESEYASLQALEYMKQVQNPEVMKALYTNSSIQQALTRILSNGTEQQVIMIASILSRYLKDTDQGTIPMSLAIQMLKFIESYLAHVNSTIKVQGEERLNTQVHDLYLNLFSELVKNFDYYQSISKQILNIFAKVFQLSNINHPVISHIVNVTSLALLFLAQNAQNFASKCKKSFCKSVYKYLSNHYQLVDQQEQQEQMTSSSRSTSVVVVVVTPLMDSTARNILKSVQILSQRSRTVMRHLDYFVGLYENQLRNER